jgi:nickel-dependent lactate racemase
MPNDLVLPVLLAELADAGVRDDQVVLINALGTHRPQTDEELVEMLGSSVIRRYKIVQHDAWDDESLSEVGTNDSGRVVRVNRAYAEASVRVLTGFIEPHFFAGLSGGPKAVLPGVADIDSIMDSHGAAMIAHPKASWANTEGNPIWEESLRVVQSIGEPFLFNVTLNRERRITGVYSGDLKAAHSAGAEFVRGSALRAVPHHYDIVVTSNSGYPLDLNLYQAVKGMSAAAQIVRPGGDIIVAAECWDGIPSHGEYGRLLREADSPEALLEMIMAPDFRCQDQWQAQIHAQIRLKARVHVHAEGLSEKELERAMVIPCPSIDETVAQLIRDNPAATIAVLPEGPQTVPFVD